MVSKKASKKKAAKPSGPSSAEKVYQALKSTRAIKKGISRTYIYKWIGDNFSGTSQAAVRRAITKGIEEGVFKYGDNKMRFVLTDEGRTKFGPKPKKKKPKKKKPTKKKKPKKKKKKKTKKKKPVKKKTTKKKKKKSAGKKKKAGKSKKKAPSKKAKKKSAAKKKKSSPKKKSASK